MLLLRAASFVVGGLIVLARTDGVSETVLGFVLITVGLGLVGWEVGWFDDWRERLGWVRKRRRRR